MYRYVLKTSNIVYGFNIDTLQEPIKISLNCLLIKDALFHNMNTCIYVRISILYIHKCSTARAIRYAICATTGCNRQLIDKNKSKIRNYIEADIMESF